MTQDIDTYWNFNKVIGEGTIEGTHSLISLKLHRSEEKYDKPPLHELFSLSSRRGTRIYFHAKPYILIPDMTLTFAAYPKPAPGGAIGEVISTDVTKLKVREIGTAQAWYYPAENALVLWECFLEAPYRTAAHPAEDALLTLLWQGFEQTLQKQLPDVSRIYTTFEPIYERPAYTQFLATQGYQQCGPVSFVKEVPSSSTEEIARL